LTCATTAAGSWTTPSIRLPSRLTTAWPSPNGTSITLAPPVRNKADAAKWVWLPAPELPIRTLPGLLFAYSTNSFSVFHGASARTASTGVSTLTRATGSKAR